jgi:CheY-like chemotaxis protein
MDTGELERPPAAQHASTLTGSKRILLVEDDLHVAETFAELLELEGYRVLVAHDAAEALEQARCQPVDVVLCDLTLPGDMDGCGFARACRDDPALEHLHLVAVSGYDRPEDRRRARSAGFDDLVGKPVNIDRIHALISRGRSAA